jgi:hypothetical protein
MALALAKYIEDNPPPPIYKGAYTANADILPSNLKSHKRIGVRIHFVFQSTSGASFNLLAKLYGYPSDLGYITNYLAYYLISTHDYMFDLIINSGEIINLNFNVSGTIQTLSVFPIPVELVKFASSGMSMVQIDTSGNAINPAKEDGNLAPASILSQGHKEVATSGTAVVLQDAPDPTTCKWVIITAKLTNTGLIYVGGPNVLVATPKGTPLSAGDSVIIPVLDLSAVFIDAVVDGEGVTFTYGA